MTPTIYTIGHGRHTLELFLNLLQQHCVELVCDVRSRARSRWARFNGNPLEASLLKNGIGYEHLPECGGKEVVATAQLKQGLDRIIELSGDARIVLMCSESQPLTRHVRPQANCHRVGLLAAPLKRYGARILHILPDGETLELDENSIPSIWDNRGVLIPTKS